MTQTPQFEVIYNSFRQPVQRYFARMGYAEHVASDLAQDTFVRVLRGLTGFRGAGLAAWVFQIARNVHFEKLRRSRAKKRAEEVSIPESFDLPDPKSEHVEDLLARESAGRIREAVGDLPPQMRRVVRLYYGQGFSCKEIGILLGSTASTVKTTLRDARKKLRVLLEANQKEARYGP